jgi:hypothetical protein
VLFDRKGRNMNLEVSANLMWLVLAIGIVLEAGKKLLALNDKAKELLPYAAIVLGVLCSWAFGKAEAIGDTVTTGIAIGVLAAGGYDAVRPILDRLKGGTAILLLACLLFVGCTFPAEYRALIDEAATVATVRDADCQAGNAEECKANSKYTTETLNALRDAAVGRVVE